MQIMMAEEKLIREEVIKRATTKRKVDYKKIVNYSLAILSIVIGIILIICNQTKTVPVEWGNNLITDFIYFCVSIGLFSGGLLIVLGICVIIEISDEKPRKKRRRTRY